MYFQADLDGTVIVERYNVTKIVVILESQDTDEELQVELSVVGCINDEPGL